MTQPGEMDLDVGLSGPGSLDPATQTPAGEPVGSPTGEDFVELRVKDEEYRLPRDEFQAMADRLGWSTDELSEALQIGRDGRNLYRGIASEKDAAQAEIRQAWEDFHARTGASPGPQRGTGLPPPAPVGSSRNRPPAEDVTGQMIWVADTMERILPTLERLPTIEQTLNQTHSRTEQREQMAEQQAERAQAATAYNDVRANWEREGFKLPPQPELEGMLRRFPITDDIDLSWHEVWDAVGWMVAGSRNARMARRRAVLDSATPRTAQPTAAAHRGAAGGGMLSPAPPQGMPPPSGYGQDPKTNEQLLAEGAALERQLSGVSVADVAPMLSRRG